MSIFRDETFWDRVNYYFSEFVLFSIQDVRITISHLVVSILSLVGAVFASRLIRGVVKKQLLPRLKLDAGMEYALLRFLHYAILILGVYTGLKVINVPLGAFVGFFALVGVGVGFGLQNLASNFISGIILLLERPVKVGDLLDVGDIWGSVTHINLRTTVITTPDDIAIIVPNSKLLEDNVTNYSYGNPRTRLHVKVGIAYGSDVDKAVNIMVQAAKEQSEVLKSPEPKVLFRSFGDSSLDMELLCWIPDASHRLDVISDINHRIDRGFRENGIVIPFPQRDVHVYGNGENLAADQASPSAKPLTTVRQKAQTTCTSCDYGLR